MPSTTNWKSAQIATCRAVLAKILSEQRPDPMAGLSAR